MLNWFKFELEFNPGLHFYFERATQKMKFEYSDKKVYEKKKWNKTYDIEYKSENRKLISEI